MSEDVKPNIYKKGKKKFVSLFLSFLLTCIVTSPLTLFVSYFTAAMAVGDGSDEFKSTFWIIFAIWELVIIPILMCLVFKFPDSFDSHILPSLGDFLFPPSRGRRGLPRKGFRIKKYDPTAWRKKNGDRIFY